MEIRNLRLLGLLLVVLVTTAVGQTARGRALVIKTEPKAVVWLNGIRYGTTDDQGQLDIKHAPAGRQLVRVRADGFKETSKTILPTQTGNIEIPLTKTTDEAELAFQEAEKLSTVDRKRSETAYRNAIKANPGFVEAHIALARVLSDAGDLEEAAKAIREAVRLRPRDPEAAAVEGRIAKLSDQEPKAIAAFKRAITNGAGFQPEAYTGLAMLYQERAEAAASGSDFALEKRNYAEAEKNFAMAVKQLGTGADAPTIYQLLGLVYEKQHKYKEAIALYEDFLRLFPNSVEATAVQSFIVQLKKQMADQK
jgi:tetratricopeptide (TPR) repeat protein